MDYQSPWVVQKRFLYDCDKYNEWGVERDYELWYGSCVEDRVTRNQLKWLITIKDKLALTSRKKRKLKQEERQKTQVRQTVLGEFSVSQQASKAQRKASPSVFSSEDKNALLQDQIEHELYEADQA